MQLMPAITKLQAEFQQLRQAIYAREEKITEAIKLLDTIGRMSDPGDYDTLDQVIKLLKGE